MAQATPAAMAGWGWVAPIGGPGAPQEPTSLCDVLGALSGEVFRIGPRAAPPAARPAAALRHHEPFQRKRFLLEGFVVPGWGRLGAAGPVEIVSDCHVVRSSGAAGAWAGFGPAGTAAGAFAGRGEVIDPDRASE